MSNKLHNRVLLPNGQFGSFPEKKLDDEVKYEQRDKKDVDKIKEALGQKEEDTVPRPKAKASKKKANTRAKKANKKQAAKQEAFEQEEKMKELKSQRKPIKEEKKEKKD